MRVLVLVPAVLAILVLATGSPSAGQAPARPNVVVVMSDDQTVESLRVMANVRALLQAQGTTFDSSFASYPLCCPSRSTFLTGQYAHNHGVLSNQPPLGGFTKLDHTNTLPVWLERAGYHTVHVGKYLNGYRQGVSPDLPPGWTEWYGSYDPTTYRFYDYTLNENGKPVTYGSDPGSYQADVYTRQGRRPRPTARAAGAAVLPLRCLPGAAQRRPARARTIRLARRPPSLPRGTRIASPRNPADAALVQ